MTLKAAKDAAIKDQDAASLRIQRMYLRARPTHIRMPSGVHACMHASMGTGPVQGTAAEASEGAAEWCEPYLQLYAHMLISITVRTSAAHVHACRARTHAAPPPCVTDLGHTRAHAHTQVRRHARRILADRRSWRQISTMYVIIVCHYNWCYYDLHVPRRCMVL